MDDSVDLNRFASISTTTPKAHRIAFRRPIEPYSTSHTPVVGSLHEELIEGDSSFLTPKQERKFGNHTIMNLRAGDKGKFLNRTLLGSPDWHS